MSLFSRLPSPPRSDLNLDVFLKGDNDGQQVHQLRRTLPAEWFPQCCVQLTWPHAGTDWAYMLEEVTECYIRMAYEIAIREKLLIVTPNAQSVKELLANRLPQRATSNIIYMECPTDDTWARDHAFLTVLAPGQPELLDFRFNGWGGKFAATQDNAINRRLYEAGLVSGTYVNRLDFELEGGSIESDGCGTLLTTSTCLLNPNRNPNFSKEEITAKLQDDLGIERVLWLDHGNLAGDDTDAHIDTLARLCPDDTIVYVACTDKDDEHYESLHLMEEQLHTFRTPAGAPYRLVPLPLPDAIHDEDGERLPATYANFLIMNGAVLFPTYAQPEKDEVARRVLQSVFEKMDIVGIDCRPLIKQHGSLHCATMQYPRGVMQM